MTQVRPEQTMVGLEAAVRGLRAELQEAMTSAEGESLRFEGGTVEMEFAVEVTADAEAHAGVKFWVVDVGAKGSIGTTGTHRVTLQLTPRTAEGASPEISDRD